MSVANTCIVCGRLSSRSVWNNTFVGASSTVYVACDFHSLAELQNAVQLTGDLVGSGGVINQDPSLTESPQT